MKKVKNLIKHIVMWKLKDFAEGKDKLENAKIIKVGLEDLQNKINQISHIEVGININESEQAYDVVLYSEFDSVDDLNLYQSHPDHVRISEFITNLRDVRHVKKINKSICFFSQFLSKYPDIAGFKKFGSLHYTEMVFSILVFAKK